MSKRRLVWNWRVGAWLEPSMSRLWFFGRVTPGKWQWRWVGDLELE